MRQTRRGIAASLVACAVALVVVLGAFGFYFVTSESAAASTASEVSSLKSSSNQATEIESAQQSQISAQQSTISCLQSEVESFQNGSTDAAGAPSVNATATGDCTTNTSSAIRLVNVTGSLTVPSGTLKGTLNVSIWNGSPLLITGISLDLTKSGLSAQNGPPRFEFGGALVSTSNPLPVGMTAMGNATLMSGSSGLFATYGYDFNVTITFDDGTSQTENLYVQAEV